MSRQQLRRQIYRKRKGGQAHLTKEQIVNLLVRPKRLRLSGSEFIPSLRVDKKI